MYYMCNTCNKLHHINKLQFLRHSMFAVYKYQKVIFLFFLSQVKVEAKTEVKVGVIYKQRDQVS